MRGWKIFLQEITGMWDEIGIYLMIKIGFNIGTGIVLGILLVTVIEGLGFSSLQIIPGMSSSQELLSTAYILPFLVMAMITLVVMTPVVTFLRYYALVFLHLLSEKYSLLPDHNP